MADSPAIPTPLQMPVPVNQALAAAGLQGVLEPVQQQRAAGGYCSGGRAVIMPAFAEVLWRLFIWQWVR